MTEDLNPLVLFFRAVIDELQKRLTPEDFANLLKECNVHSENEGTRTNTKLTPGQMSLSAE